MFEYNPVLAVTNHTEDQGASCSWSYVSCIYNYLCKQCLSTLKLWVQIPLMAKCTRYNIMWLTFVSDLQQVGGFSPSTLVSSNNKTDRYDITETLLKVALNTITISQRRHGAVLNNPHKISTQWNINVVFTNISQYGRSVIVFRELPPCYDMILVNLRRI